MRRIPILAIVVFGAMLIVSSAIAATQLTSKNSISFRFFTSSDERFTGTNCGTTAVVTKTLPTGSTGVTVLEPKVGFRDAGGGTQVTDVSVAGTVVNMTALADGPSICDPALTGYLPGEPVAWTADYSFSAEYTRRVQTTMRVYFESYEIGAKWKIRPKTIYESRAGTSRSTRSRVTGIKWKQFGGKKAIGFGRQRLDYCRRGENCPDNGKRVRLVASKPDYCKDSGKIEYLKLDIYVGRRLDRGLLITCSP